jgi:hypothetical protein
MTNQPSRDIKVHLKASLTTLGIAYDDARLAHLEPLATSLLADGERMIELAAAAGEPRTILRLRETEASRGRT